MSRTKAATCITVVVCLSAALINYWSLQEVAVAARIDWRLAYLYPLTIDGLGLAGLVAVDTLSGWRRGYAWCVVVVAFLLSLGGGAAHSLVDPQSGALALEPWARAIASAVAGLSAFGTVHLLALARRRPAEPAESAKASRTPRKPRPAQLTVVETHEPQSDRVGQVRAWIRAGERLSNAIVAQRLGVSRATGGRVLAQAREAS